MPSPKPALPEYQHPECRAALIEAIEEYAAACHRHRISEFGSETRCQQWDRLVAARKSVCEALFEVERQAALAGIAAANRCRFIPLGSYSDEDGNDAEQAADEALEDWCVDLERAVDDPRNVAPIEWGGETFRAFVPEGKESNP